VGVYLSMRLKTTGGAVASTLGVYLAPKLFCCGIPGPFLLLMANSAAGSANALFTLTVVTPVVHATVGWLCMRAATRRVRRDIFR